MQTSALDSAQGQSQLLRQLMELARANASQEDSSGQAGSAQSAQGDQAGSPLTPPAPPATGSTPADMFSGPTLGALTSAQEGAGGWRHQMDSIVADQMVSQLDTNGDGSLSLSEIETALGVSGGSDPSGSSTGAATNALDGLTAAFAQVDSNGDGQLSADELTNALGQMQGHRGHHHHHHDDGDQDDALASSSGATPTVPGSSTTSGAGSTGTPAVDPTLSDPTATASTSTTSVGASAGSGAAATASGATSASTVATLDGLSDADFAQALQAFLASLAQSQAANLNALGPSANPTSVTA